MRCKRRRNDAPSERLHSGLDLCEDEAALTSDLLPLARRTKDGPFSRLAGPRRAGVSSATGSSSADSRAGIDLAPLRRTPTPGPRIGVGIDPCGSRPRAAVLLNAVAPPRRPTRQFRGGGGDALAHGASRAIVQCDGVIAIGATAGPVACVVRELPNTGWLVCWPLSRRCRGTAVPRPHRTPAASA